MKQLFALAIVASAFAMVGCQHHNLNKGCSDCGSVKHAAVAGGQSDVQLANYNMGGGGAVISDGAVHGADCDCDGGAGHAHGHENLSGYGFAGLRNPQAVPVMPHRGHHAPPVTGPAGPSTAHVGYPYYTTRGPRDFLMANPPTIGH